MRDQITGQCNCSQALASFLLFFIGKDNMKDYTESEIEEKVTDIWSGENPNIDVLLGGLS